MNRTQARDEDATLTQQMTRLLAAGLRPEDASKVRRRLGEDASPEQVLAELTSQQRLPLTFQQVGDPGVGDAADGESDCIPEDAEWVLVSGRTMPARLSRTWVDGGPLWVRLRGGPLPADRLPHVAIVGTRRPTHDGLRLAGTIAQGLAEAGVVVVSGLAKGIDQAAHRGALRGTGTTVAVIGTGHDVDYPAGSAELRQAIARSGGVLSEYAPSRGVRYPGQFTDRNRILVGLCDALLVIEAGHRSGALNSATWAADFNRDVMVVPSSPSNVAATGALRLLSEGAIPVCNAGDVLGVLGIDSRAGSVGGGQGALADLPVLPPLDRLTRVVLDLTGPLPVSPSTLSASSGLSSREVLVALSTLEDLGLVCRYASGIIRL